MELYVEDYGFKNKKEFKDALDKYTKQVEDHATTINQAAPTPEHQIFKQCGESTVILSRAEGAKNQAAKDKKDQEDRLKEQEKEQKKQAQHEIDRRTVGHDAYNYVYARELEYGTGTQRFEIIIEKIKENGGDVVRAFKELASRNYKIKEKYPKPDADIT